MEIYRTYFTIWKYMQNVLHNLNIFIKVLKMLLLLLLLLLLILCVYPCVYVHVCFGAWGGQSNIWDSVSLGLQVVGSSLMWLLGIEFWFSDRAASTLKHGTILQTFIKVILKKSISSLT